METLADRIDRDGPLAELDAVGWTIRLCKRIECLHALGVSHGAVSPACVLVAASGRMSAGFLADVGRTPMLPAFQSPERARGGDLSRADDTWATAATLYALITGKAPFGGATPAEVRKHILAASPPPLAVYDVGDDDLQELLDRALARERAVRITSVAELRRALEAWHPDPSTRELPPLQDEIGDADEAEDRTVMRAPRAEDAPTRTRDGGEDDRAVMRASGAEARGAAARARDHDGADDVDDRIRRIEPAGASRDLDEESSAARTITVEGRAEILRSMLGSYPDGAHPAAAARVSPQPASRSVEVALPAGAVPARSDGARAVVAGMIALVVSAAITFVVLR